MSAPRQEESRPSRCDRTPKPTRETIRHDARLDERTNAARYDAKAAEIAWNRTVNFSKQHLM